MAFPVSPTNGQITVVNNITYQFSNVGNTWTRLVSTANTITANIITANTLNINTAISVTGNVTGNYILGNGSLLTGIATGAASNITSGTSNVTIVSSGGNVTVGVGGTGNVAVFATTGEYVTGVISASGNVTGGNILTAGYISATGTLSVSGNTTVANVSAGNISAGNVTTGGLVSATANVTGGNLLTAGLISAGGTVTGTSYLGAVVSVTGNITGNYIIGNGSQLTGLAATYGNANVVANLAALGSNPVSTTGNVTGGNLVGNVLSPAQIVINAAGQTEGGQLVLAWANLGGFTGQSNSTWNLDVDSSNVLRVFYQNAVGTTSVLLQANATSNVLSFPSTAGVSATGNVTGGNILTGGYISATGNHIGNVFTVNVGNTANAIINGGANGVGNIGTATSYFNTVFGKATTAQYADLAELYSADAKYEPGTVLVFGGNNEVTISTASADPRVAGVVSTNPAHLMNSVLESEHKVAVALQGRVPTSVVGTIRKGDMMVTAGNGFAQASATPAMGTVIGKALENFDGASGTIEIVVGRL